MIPSEGKDFTGPHGGFEGEEEGGSDLFSRRAYDELGYSPYFGIAYTSPTGWRFARPLNPFERAGLQPLPLPDGNAE